VIWLFLLHYVAEDAVRGVANLGNIAVGQMIMTILMFLQAIPKGRLPQPRRPFTDAKSAGWKRINGEWMCPSCIAFNAENKKA
jgi:rubredoxin